MIALTPDEEQEVIALIARVEKDRLAHRRNGRGLSASQLNDWLFGIEMLLLRLGRPDLFRRGIALGAQDDTPAEPAGPLRGRP